MRKSEYTNYLTTNLNPVETKITGIFVIVMVLLAIFVFAYTAITGEVYEPHENGLEAYF